MKMWISKVVLTDIINDWLQKPGRSVFFEGSVYPGDRVEARYVEGIEGDVCVNVSLRSPVLLPKDCVDNQRNGQ